MEHLHFQAFERPISRHRSRAVVSGVDFSGRSVKGEVSCSFTYAKLNNAFRATSSFKSPLNLPIFSLHSFFQAKKGKQWDRSDVKFLRQFKFYTAFEKSGNHVKV